ncbi:unnamed protein product [Acanthosepion pharaonis]|uniref:Chromo domain-containing protein n=1 Tax=Acanthosepion pharaonis TaxID=158019 RepID=A0A812EAM1_ACAPH|nr:unnamed protein product [Sepia pharaonis]
MAEEKEGVTTASSEQKTREMDGKKNYGRRKLPSDTIRESEEFFEVDKIVGMTKINGKERYKVRWVGYPASNDTWEPRENLLPCIEMVEDFERDRQRLKKRRAEERRIRKSQRHDPLAMMEGRLLPGTPLPDGKILSTATTTTTTTPTPTSSLTTASYGNGCRQPNSKDSPPSLQQVDCAVNEGTESDQSSKSQIACDTSSQNCDCDNKSSPSSSPSSALRLQNLKDPTHSLAKKRRTRLRPNRNIVISYSSKRKKTKFQNIRTSPKKTMRSTMNLLPPEKSNCNIFAMGESSVDSGVSSLRTETETEMDSNSPGLESIASTVSVSRSMTPQDTGSVCLLEEDPVNSELVLMPLETSAISSCQLVLPCDIGTELKTPTDEKSGVDTRCSTKIKPCSSTPETCPETNSEIKQTIHLSQMSGYTLSDQSFGSYSNSNKASLGNPTRWEISALLKLQNPLNSIRNKIVRNFFDNCTAEELTNFCSCSSRLDRSRNIESSTPTSVKKARLSNNVIQISKDEFVQAVLAGDYERLKSALRGDRSHYDLESPNVDGYTLIMQSILRGFSDITLLLALAGAQLDKSLSSGETALMLACTRGEVAAVEVLVKLGANLEKYTSNKETALIKSIYSGNLQIVKLLLDHGANMGFQNRDNFNVLDLVCANPSLQGMQAILTMYHDKFMTQMKDCINVWLKGEHQLVEEVFPTQCMALSKGRKIQISFRHYQQECEHYEGYLLFLVHVNDIGALHIGCRLKGESVVTNVYLNGGSEKQVSLPSKFVTSFRNLKHGDNTLRIETKPDARMTLLIFSPSSSFSLSLSLSLFFFFFFFPASPPLLQSNLRPYNHNCYWLLNGHLGTSPHSLHQRENGPTLSVYLASLKKLTLSPCQVPKPSAHLLFKQHLFLSFFLICSLL